MSKILNTLDIGDNTAPSPLPNAGKVSAFSRFWQATKGNGWNMVKINLLSLLFALPIVAWSIIMYMASSADSLMLPYSANIGIGLPVVVNAVEWGIRRAFMFTVRRWLIMIPLIVVASIGFSGAFYAVKYMYRGEGKPTVKVFFQGVKKCSLYCLVCSVPVALSLFALFYNIGAYNVPNGFPTAVKILFIALSALALFVSLLLTVFIVTQAASYNLKVGSVILNALKFSVALLPRSFVVLAICAVPVVLVIVLTGFLSTFILMFFMLVGITCIVLALTVYSQWAFDKYINPRLNQKDKGDGMSRKQRKRMEAVKRKQEHTAGAD